MEMQRVKQRVRTGSKIVIKSKLWEDAVGVKVKFVLEMTVWEL